VLVVFLAMVAAVALVVVVAVVDSLVVTRQAVVVLHLAQALLGLTGSLAVLVGLVGLAVETAVRLMVEQGAQLVVVAVAVGAVAVAACLLCIKEKK